MRALFLVTHTPNCEVFWKSLESVGVDVYAHQYNDRPHDLTAMARSLKPDVIIYVGAFLGGQTHWVPNPHELKQLRSVAPSILLACDASDKVWHQTFGDYAAYESFDLRVSIDGTDHNGFVTKLTPIDPRVYHPKPWSSRTITIGYTGGDCGGERFDVIKALGATVCGPATHEQMAAFLCDTKYVVNAPLNGGGVDHVKGRVLEAAFAGACVLERRNAAIERWFIRNIDYIDYLDPADAVTKMAVFLKHDDQGQDIAGSLHREVLREHSPAAFWGDVLDRVGRRL